MTRPDFYKGIHPQLDSDVAAQRREEYMAKLEQQRDELLTLLDRIKASCHDDAICNVPKIIEEAKA